MELKLELNLELELSRLSFLQLLSLPTLQSAKMETWRKRECPISTLPFFAFPSYKHKIVRLKNTLLGLFQKQSSSSSINSTLFLFISSL